jgi:hypothetical protein
MIRPTVRSTVVVLVLLSALAASAAPAGQPPRERIVQFKKMKLLEMLNLDEATADKFLPRYTRWMRELDSANQARMESYRQLREAVQDAKSDADLAELVDAARNADERFQKGKYGMVDDMKSILSPRQLAKLIIFETQFQQRLQEAVGRLKGGRHGGSPGMRDNDWR